MEPTQIHPFALVSQGGGARGAFTAGVQDVLLREKIRFSYVIGTSAGALNNVDFVSEDSGRSKIVTTEILGDKKFLSLHNLVHKKGLFDFHYLTNELPQSKLPFDFETFKNSPTRYVCAATSVETGEAVYFEKGIASDIWAAISASASLPLLNPPVLIDGKRYLDGGPVAPIPFRQAIAEGYDRIVVILTRTRDYRKKPKMNPAKAALAKTQFRKDKAFLKAYLKWNAVYNKDMEALLLLEKQGKAFIIAPSEPITISKTERSPKKLVPIYERGVADMEALLPDLKKFLSYE